MQQPFARAVHFILYDGKSPTRKRIKVLISFEYLVAAKALNFIKIEYLKAIYAGNLSQFSDNTDKPKSNLYILLSTLG